MCASDEHKEDPRVRREGRHQVEHRRRPVVEGDALQQHHARRAEPAYQRAPPCQRAFGNQRGTPSTAVLRWGGSAGVRRVRLSGGSDESKLMRPLEGLVAKYAHAAPLVPTSSQLLGTSSWHESSRSYSDCSAAAADAEKPGAAQRWCSAPLNSSMPTCRRAAQPRCGLSGAPEHGMPRAGSAGGRSCARLWRPLRCRRRGRGRRRASRRCPSWAPRRGSC